LRTGSRKKKTTTKNVAKPEKNTIKRNRRGRGGTNELLVQLSGLYVRGGE